MHSFSCISVAQKHKCERIKALLLSQNRNLQSENSSMRKQINEINGELNNVQVRENILKNQVQNQVRNDC